MSGIQKEIEDIYKISTGVHVKDYLIGKDICNALLQKYPTIAWDRGRRGILFMSQKDYELDLAVYIDEDIVSSIGSFSPVCLTPGFLANMSTAIEEVSHFVYIVWNALHDRHITRFEMELQAEVDKYIVLLFYYIKDRERLRNIKDTLFYNFSYNDVLSHEEIERYKRANRIAFKYCNFLETEFVMNNYLTRLIKDIRIFYRLTHNSKLDHIRDRI